MKQIYLIFFLFLVIPAAAQKESNNWYFGNGAGFGFNLDNPGPFTDGAINTWEASSSISDANGNLLFYTNGNTVWTKEHGIMTNGTGLSGSSSSTQGALIIPKPGSNHIYYIFTTGDQGQGGLRYSEVNISLNSGLGAVTSKNILLQTNINEKLAAVLHDNANQVWVVCHGSTNNAFYAFLVTEQGISNTPVVSFSGTNHQNTTLGTSGAMKISPDGAHLALAVRSPSFVEIFDFNKSSGSVSNVSKLDYFGEEPYGIEFSPDNSKLYVGAIKSSGSTSNLYQYSFENGKNPSVLKATEYKIGFNYRIYALQAGSNKQIYVSKMANSLDIIKFPNLSRGSLGYQVDGQSLSGKMSGIGLPNFISTYFIENLIEIKDSCLGTSTRFQILLGDIDSIIWDFGDNTFDPIENKKTIANHTYSTAGTYNVNVQFYRKGYFFNYTRSFTIHTYPSLELGNDTTLCRGNTLVLNSYRLGASYLWNTGANTPNLTVRKEGKYILNLSLNGCIVKDSIQVFYDQVKAQIQNNNLSTQCESTNYFNFIAINNYQVENNWSLGDGTYKNKQSFSYSYNKPDNYEVKLIVKSVNSCYDTAYLPIQIIKNPSAEIISDLPEYCKNNQIVKISGVINSLDTLTKDQISLNKINWANFPPSYYEANNLPVGESKFYRKTTSNKGCVAIDSVTVRILESPTANFNFTKGEFCQNSEIIMVNNSSTNSNSYDWKINTDLISNDKNLNVSFSKSGNTSVKLIAKNDNGCSDSLIKTVFINPEPIADFTISNEGVCLGNSPISFINTSNISDNSSLSYKWNFGDNTFSTQKDPQKIYLNVDEYTVNLEVSSIKGCKSNKAKIINTYEKPNPDFNLISGNLMCENDAQIIAVKLGSEDISKYQWFLNGTLIDQDYAVSIKNLAPGNHTLKLILQNSFGCIDSSAELIRILNSPKPNFDISPSILCEGNHPINIINKTVYSGSGNLSYEWNVNGSIISTSVNPDQIYSGNAGTKSIKLYVRSSNNCDAELSKEIQINSKPDINLDLDKTCESEALNIINKTIVNNGFVSDWNWTIESNKGNFYSNSFIPDLRFNDPQTLKIFLTATSNQGCISSKEYSMEILEKPNAEFASVKSGYLQNQTKVNFIPSEKNAIKYEWTSNVGHYSEAESPEFIFNDDTLSINLKLKVTGQNGCITEKSENLLIVPAFDFFAPNAFTPNKDGKNEVFNPFMTPPYYKEYYMTVKNRWGQIIFESKTYDVKWDGNYLGQNLPTDTYYFEINLTDLDGKSYKFNGPILLIR